MERKERPVLKVFKLCSGSRLPSKSYEGDLGYDLFSSEDVCVKNGSQKAVATGISVEFPAGWGGFIKDRSSMAVKGIYTSAGVIDNGYRGEVRVVIRNESGKEFIVCRGDRVAQLVPIPVTDWDIKEIECDERDASDRKERGFGSSGK